MNTTLKPRTCVACRPFWLWFREMQLERLAKKKLAELSSGKLVMYIRCFLFRSMLTASNGAITLADTECAHLLLKHIFPALSKFIPDFFMKCLLRGFLSFNVCWLLLALLFAQQTAVDVCDPPRHSCHGYDA